MAKSYEWWVNAEGEVLRHEDDQSARGFSPLEDPRDIVVGLGELTIHRRCPSPDGDVLVPVKAERVPGALLWRWRYTGGEIRMHEDTMEYMHE